ncbi:complexin-2 [Clostridium porci]|uniref:Complexin-2 n=1 Tax=Clostridium porci TaxID=2605778 RepID=A0A7X2NJC9_9CLOT|nr:complexin-2 [Clostridium porci]MSS35987.1 complexin-2 [Clostridium porci]
MKQIQIPQELFVLLIRYHLMNDVSLVDEIKIELGKKLDAMVLRQLYGKSKTAPTEAEREKARKEYLDRRGIPDSFRW